MRFVLAAFLAVLCGQNASADLILQFGQGGTTAGIGTSFSATAGGQITLDVWLTQSGVYDIAPPNGVFFGDYRLSSGDPSARGLGSYVFDVTSSASGVMPSSVNAYGAGFLADGALVQPGGNVLRVGAIATDDVSGSTITPVTVLEPYVFSAVPNTGSVENNSILLGSVTLDVDANALGAINIAASSPYDGSDPEAPEALLFFGLGNNLLTPTIAVPSSANATINVVPEPSALGGIFVGAIALLRRRRRD